MKNILKLKTKIEVGLVMLFLVAISISQATVTINNSSITTTDSTLNIDFVNNYINVSNITTGVINVSGGVNATHFYGDGSNLAGIVTTESDPVYINDPAFNVTDRIAMLADGEIVFDGTPKEALKTNNKFMNMFIKSSSLQV